MPYYIWILANLVFVIMTGLFIWLFQTQASSVVTIGQLLAQVSIILFLINVNMYFIFLVIRKTRVRKVKLTLAKLSRKMMKAHIPLALIGSFFILIHGVVMLINVGERIGFGHGKLVSGYFSLFLLALTLYAGYLRHKKASGFRKKFHRIMAFSFTIIFTIHLFFPL